MTMEQLLERLETTESTTLTGWNVLLWNDDHHSMDYVVLALVRTLPVDAEQADSIMLDAHSHGKTVAWSGAKEIAELYRDRLEGYGLGATISR
ncbi:MAG: ATP-dependent Clp protease adaptor ClpS [Chloroflexia bacterium]|jgi:ATP-dependent Clp protease adaptor protein ClpS|nr:ATP-dependent Clp protease adaptor ClpS [Chloroflexia bacterium]